MPQSSLVHWVARAVRQIPGSRGLINRVLLARVEPGSLGLTTRDERTYFTEVASSAVQGRGAVIDLGSWLGSTTASLAQGLDANPSPKARALPIHTYDLFAWDHEYDPFAPRGFRLAHGESFLPLFRANVRPWLDRIEVHQGDLNKATWNGPVELILDDAAKTWGLMGTIWRQFVTALLRDGLLIEQDFKHYYCPWLHLVHFRFRDHFALAHDVVGGSTTAFRLVREVSPAELGDAFTPTAYSPTECEDAFAWAKSLVDSWWHPVLQAAHAMHYVHLGDHTAARSVFNEIPSDGRQHPDVMLTEARVVKLEQAAQVARHDVASSRTGQNATR
jgi:hypothetical protein